MSWKTQIFDRSTWWHVIHFRWPMKKEWDSFGCKKVILRIFTFCVNSKLSGRLPEQRALAASSNGLKLVAWFCSWFISKIEVECTKGSLSQHRPITRGIIQMSLWVFYSFSLWLTSSTSLDMVLLFLFACDLKFVFIFCSLDLNTSINNVKLTYYPLVLGTTWSMRFLALKISTPLQGFHISAGIFKLTKGSLLPLT